jgi:hypothetical protein
MEAVAKRAEKVRELDDAVKLAGATPELKTQMRAARRALAAAVRALTKSVEGNAMQTVTDKFAAKSTADVVAAGKQSETMLHKVQQGIKHEATEFGAMYSEGSAVPEDVGVLKDVASAISAQSGGYDDKISREAYDDERARIAARKDQDDRTKNSKEMEKIRKENDRIFRKMYTDHGIDPYTCDVAAVLENYRRKLAAAKQKYEDAGGRIKELKAKDASKITAADVSLIAGLKDLREDIFEEMTQLKYVIEDLPITRKSYDNRFIGFGIMAALAVAYVVFAAYNPELVAEWMRDKRFK